MAFVVGSIVFYYLKGGQVDYGEEHSKIFGHSQFGRIYEEGHYPKWDEDHSYSFCWTFCRSPGGQSPSANDVRQG
ncbi:hypothetical protein IFM89_031100 [Coptis chinensis]|uniref:Lipase-like C-terminal domain-containing protein n=1 Tax=Coptis chinensis TaxID=261450 RepID=A0A835MAC7_9MAGN|nr:hypothetical protein IFM89_031100 [Coptis chinensis]